MPKGGRIVERFLGKSASALIPVVMSLIVLVLVAVQVSIHGLGPEPDEGTLANLY
jgi:small neutral amino acid transporter SnatA (MarC family)